MVIGIKDNLCYKNHLVSASSKILEGYKSLYNATSIQGKLHNEKDKISVSATMGDDLSSEDLEEVAY